MIGTDKLLYKCKLLNDLSGGSFLKKLFDVQLLVTSWKSPVTFEGHYRILFCKIFIYVLDIFATHRYYIIRKHKKIAQNTNTDLGWNSLPTEPPFYFVNYLAIQLTHDSHRL